MKATHTEIDLLVSKEYRHTWYALEPDVYYKDGSVFGLIKLVPNAGLPIINSLSLDDTDYTIAMRKRIIKTIRQHRQIIVMSTVKNSPALNKLMDRYVDKGIYSYFVKGL